MPPSANGSSSSSSPVVVASAFTAHLKPSKYKNGIPQKALIECLRCFKPVKNIHMGTDEMARLACVSYTATLIKAAVQLMGRKEQTLRRDHIAAAAKELSKRNPENKDMVRHALLAEREEVLRLEYLKERNAKRPPPNKKKREQKEEENGEAAPKKKRGRAPKGLSTKDEQALRQEAKDLEASQQDDEANGVTAGGDEDGTSSSSDSE